MSFRISSFIAAVSSETTARDSKRSTAQGRIALLATAADHKTKAEQGVAGRPRKHRLLRLVEMPNESRKSPS